MIRDTRGSLISDHALLRFMQRVVGINLDDWEALMNMHLDAAKDMGDGWMIGPDGTHYVVGDKGSIITVLDPVKGRQTRGEMARRRR